MIYYLVLVLGCLFVFTGVRWAVIDSMREDVTWWRTSLSIAMIAFGIAELYIASVLK